MLNRKLILLIFILSACQVKNSNSQDVSKYSESKQLSILSSRCGQCHAFSSYSDAQFVSLGLIVPGEPQNSNLFRRIQGSRVGGAEDMPPAGAAGGSPSSEEIQIISDWITSIGGA